jgi:PadR family transcriptional regulator, regulatory protein AphA
MKIAKVVTMAEIKLTPTSYVVLGLVALAGEATPYDLKRRVADSVGYVWSFPHAQLYTEPARLAAAGLLKEQREKGGRNRRHFTITVAGNAALRKWLSQPGSERDEPRELRDPGLLRLFFADLLSSAELSELAREQEASHRKRLALLEADATRFGPASVRDASFGPLRMGLVYERAALGFWNEIAKEGSKHGKKNRNR